MLPLPNVDILFCSLSDGATIMSTTNTPFLSRSQNKSLVIFFSMYDPEVSNTTLFPCLTIFVTDPSAPLTFATRNVIYLSCVPSDVDMSYVFSSSFSTVVPSTVVWNTPRLDPSDSNVLCFGIHVLGVSVSAAPLSTTEGCGKAFTRWTISHSGSLSLELLNKIPTTLGSISGEEEPPQRERAIHPFPLSLVVAPSPLSLFCGGGGRSCVIFSLVWWWLLLTALSLWRQRLFQPSLSLSLALLMVAASPFSVFCGGGGGFPFPLVQKISTRGASFFF